MTTAWSCQESAFLTLPTKGYKVYSLLTLIGWNLYWEKSLFNESGSHKALVLSSSSPPSPSFPSQSATFKLHIKWHFGIWPIESVLEHLDLHWKFFKMLLKQKSLSFQKDRRRVVRQTFVCSAIETLWPLKKFHFKRTKTQLTNNVFMHR